MFEGTVGLVDLLILHSVSAAELTGSRRDLDHSAPASSYNINSVSVGVTSISVAGLTLRTVHERVQSRKTTAAAPAATV